MSIRTAAGFVRFLMVVLKRFLLSARIRAQRLKRGGDFEFVSIEHHLAGMDMVGSSVSPECGQHGFDRKWAERLSRQALYALGAEYAGHARTRVFSELRPFLTGTANLPTQEEAARRLRIRVETLRCQLSRLRVRYREILREQVARAIGINDDVDEELRYLCEVLISAACLACPPKHLASTAAAL